MFESDSTTPLRGPESEYRSAPGTDAVHYGALGKNAVLEVVAAPQGARSTVLRGPGQLVVLIPSALSLVPRCVVVFLCVFFLMVMGGAVFGACFAIAFGAGVVAIGPVLFIVMILVAITAFCRKARGTKLEILGNEFRLSRASKLSRHSVVRKHNNTGGKDWKRLTKVPEIGTRYPFRAGEHYAVVEDNTVHNHSFIVLVADLESFEVGNGLSSLEVEWLLERIKEVVSLRETP